MMSLLVIYVLTRTVTLDLPVKQKPIIITKPVTKPLVPRGNQKLGDKIKDNNGLKELLL